jgi:hypothetical protein
VIFSQVLSGIEEAFAYLLKILERGMTLKNPSPHRGRGTWERCSELVVASAS